MAVLLHGRGPTEAELRGRRPRRRAPPDQENQIIRDVRVAYLNATTAFQKLALARELLQQAQLALDLAQSRYDLGLGSIVELSQAQLNLTNAQLADASAKYDYQSQRVNLSYQSGVLH